MTKPTWPPVAGNSAVTLADNSPAAGNAAGMVAFQTAMFKLGAAAAEAARADEMAGKVSRGAPVTPSGHSCIHGCDPTNVVKGYPLSASLSKEKYLLHCDRTATCGKKCLGWVPAQAGKRSSCKRPGLAKVLAHFWPDEGEDHNAFQRECEEYIAQLLRARQVMS